MEHPSEYLSKAQSKAVQVRIMERYKHTVIVMHISTVSMLVNVNHAKQIIIMQYCKFT